MEEWEVKVVAALSGVRNVACLELLTSAVSPLSFE